MKRIIIFPICVLALALPALAETGTETATNPDPIEILKKVDAAAKAVNGVWFKAAVKVSGIATSRMSDAEGEVVMIGWNGNIPEKFYSRVKTTQPGSEEPMELEGGGDGDSFFLVDHAAKKGYEDMDPGVMGSSGNALRALSMIEFVHATPFSDEINADKAEIVGSETVGGVECYQIHVVYAGGQGESTWSFSKEDYLPRRRVRHFTIPDQGEGTIEITVTDLQVDPKVEPARFKMKLPAGYEKIDDFAP